MLQFLLVKYFTVPTHELLAREQQVYWKRRVGELY